jgi:DNA-binding transcriptional regulator WhiA
VNLKSKKTLAYIIGVALGDGNLSNPNGRAIRLRITCDARYPKLAQDIINALKFLLPQNAVSKVYVPGQKKFFNISVYSNKLTEWIPWKTGRGPKEVQRPRVPIWILQERKFAAECLRGLLQTDGSIYRDRGYLMVNFTNHSHPLIKDVQTMLSDAGFRPTLSVTPAKGGKIKYTVRVARQPEKLIKYLKLYKA